MAAAVIIDVVRTAGVKRGGALAGWHALDLAAITPDALLDRTAGDRGALEDVIMGRVTQTGEQRLHIGRHTVLASRLPSTVPSITIDRQRGSFQQAVQFAAQAGLSGTSQSPLALNG